jgi:hypothetical protein
MHMDAQETEDTMRGGGRQCKTIDAIAYNVAYIATIACDAALLMQSHAMRRQRTFSSSNNGASTTMFIAAHRGMNDGHNRASPA